MALEKGTEESKNSNNELADLKAKMELMEKELKESKNAPVKASASIGGLDAQQFAEIIAAVTKAAKETPKADIKAGVFVNEQDIDAEDFDENGVLFCAYSTGYFIVDDVKQGLPISTPYNNVLTFMFQGHNKTRDSKGREVLNSYCSYLSRSKKEQEFLRKHRFFGIKFFESAKDALSATSMEAQRLVKFIDAVMSMDQGQIIAACKSKGINITNDMQKMRVTLANTMLEESENAKTQAYKNILEANKEEELFLADTSKLSKKGK